MNDKIENALDELSLASLADEYYASAEALKRRIAKLEAILALPGKLQKGEKRVIERLAVLRAERLHCEQTGNYLRGYHEQPSPQSSPSVKAGGGKL